MEILLRMTFHPSDLFGWHLLLLSFSVMGFAVVWCFVIVTKWRTPELTKQFVRGLCNGRRVYECNCRTKYSSGLPEVDMGPI